MVAVRSGVAGIMQLANKIRPASPWLRRSQSFSPLANSLITPVQLMSMSACQESENFWAHIVSCAWPTYLLASLQISARGFAVLPSTSGGKLIAEHRPLFSSFSWVFGSHRRSGAAVGVPRFSYGVY